MRRDFFVLVEDSTGFVILVKRWKYGKVEPWKGGKVERWKGGEVERWKG